MNDRLQDEAVELDPSMGAEEKARRLRDALREQAEGGEAKEAADIGAASSAPAEASPGVADHEEEMLRRGFGKQGPP